MKNTIFNSLKVGLVASILGATIFAGTVNSAGTAGGAQLLIPTGKYEYCFINCKRFVC